MKMLLEIGQKLEVPSNFTTIKRVRAYTKKNTRRCKTIDTFIVPPRECKSLHLKV